MVITSDFNIFADKYHNRQHLPDDLIKMIMNINTEEIKAKKQTKQKFKNVIQVIQDHRNFFNEVQDFNDNESIGWILDIRKVNALDDFIDYKNKK
jgi:hypothetical protein